MLLSELFEKVVNYKGEIKYKNGGFVGMDPQNPMFVEFLVLDSPCFILKNEWGDVIQVKGEEVTIYKNLK